MRTKLYLFLIVLFILSACSPAVTPVVSNTEVDETVSETELVDEVEPINNAAATETEQPITPTPSPRPTLAPDAWMEMPVVPVISDTARDIYQRGLEMGNNPNAFSKIGDCQNINSYFLAVFEKPKEFKLGEDYAYLQETIDYFDGSFSRESLSVQNGYNVAAVLSPLRADKSVCEPTESPIACELRLNQPSFVFISLETWWANKPAEEYERYMRQIVEYAIEQGVVPILATKADNLEGDNGVNRVIAKAAYEYDIPLWNYWRATQALPHDGLADDGFHLTFARNYFDDPVRMESAWPWRNLTALQSLDAVWRGVTE